jgi:hypothetical protein
VGGRCLAVNRQIFPCVADSLQVHTGADPVMRLRGWWRHCVSRCGTCHCNFLGYTCHNILNLVFLSRWPLELSMHMRMWPTRKVYIHTQVFTCHLNAPVPPFVRSQIITHTLPAQQSYALQRRCRHRNVQAGVGICSRCNRFAAGGAWRSVGQHGLAPSGRSAVIFRAH